MNTNNTKNNEDEMLREAYEQITPADSWDELRSRINERLYETRANSLQATIQKSLRFWKRFSMVMAAGFLITAGVLLYNIGLNQGAKLHYNQTAQVNKVKTIERDDISKLIAAFTQVQQLFGDQSRWIVLGDNDESQIGVVENAEIAADTQKLVVVRLALDTQGQNRRYYDIVTYPNQTTKLQLPLANAVPLKIDMIPVIKSDGTISVEIGASVNGISQSKNKSSLSSESFTTLLNMPVDGQWLKIDGVGRYTTSGGKMML